MGIIQCSEECKFQIDGYCGLEKCSTVSSIFSECPYLLPRSADNADCLSKTSNAD